MSNNDSETLYRQVPTIQPTECLDFGVFRETFLAGFNDAEDNRAMRFLATLLSDGRSEHLGPVPPSPIHEIVDQLRAALADLRYLQGYVGGEVRAAEWQREDGGVKEDQLERHQELCDLGLELQAKIGALADGLERELEALKPV